MIKCNLNIFITKNSNDNLRELTAKYAASVEIQELRNYQQNNILEEVKKTEQSILENKNSIDSLGMEVIFYKQK